MHGRGVIKGRSGRRLLRRAAHRVTCARRTTARGGPLVVANSSSSTQAYRSIDAVGRPHPGCRWHRRGTSSRVVACVAGRPLLFCVCTVGSAPRAQGRRRSAAAGLERATRRAHRANGAFPLVAQLIDQLACMQGVHANHSTPQHIHASPPPTSSQTRDVLLAQLLAAAASSSFFTAPLWHSSSPYSSSSSMRRIFGAPKKKEEAPTLEQAGDRLQSRGDRCAARSRRAAHALRLCRCVLAARRCSRRAGLALPCPLTVPRLSPTLTTKQ